MPKFEHSDMPISRANINE